MIFYVHATLFCRLHWDDTKFDIMFLDNPIPFRQIALAQSMYMDWFEVDLDIPGPTNSEGELLCKPFCICFDFF